MRILVTVASKHGGTAAIGQAIARRLRATPTERRTDAAAPVHVDLRDPDGVIGLGGYDAAVIGSAVYAGWWRPPARHFVERHATELRTMPVWLFSSGPVGEPPGPDTTPVDVARMCDLTGAVEHRIFAGEVDRATMNVAERAIVSALGIEEGGYTDWRAVEGWADTIAATLREAASARPPRRAADGSRGPNADYEGTRP